MNHSSLHPFLIYKRVNKDLIIIFLYKNYDTSLTVILNNFNKIQVNLRKNLKKVCILYVFLRKEWSI